MNNVPKLFIETTVFNFYLEGKNGQKQKDAIRLFGEIAKGRYDAYTSEEVLRELVAAPEEKYVSMFNLFGQYINKTIDAIHESELLAEMYVSKGIIPEKYYADALHIAMATVHNLDFVISYNLGHIVKTKTMIGTGFVNLRQGYNQIGLGTPTEVLEYDC
jgi:predicted nucleic acid-binding protein